MNKVNYINYTDAKTDRMNITILKDCLDNYDCPNEKLYDNSKIIKIRKQNKLGQRQRLPRQRVRSSVKRKPR